MIKIDATKFITNTSAILAATVVALESNSMGVRKAISNSKLQGAKDTTRDLIGASKLNYASPMYSEAKNGIFKLKTPNPIMDVVHGVAGYFKGFGSGVAHNWLTASLAAVTLAVPKMFKPYGAVALGLSVAWNFLQNGTNLFEKKDYLD